MSYAGIPLLFTRTNENNEIIAAYNSRFVILPLDYMYRQSTQLFNRENINNLATKLSDPKYKSEFFSSYIKHAYKTDNIFIEELTHHHSLRNTSLWSLFQCSNIVSRACIAYLCFAKLKGKTHRDNYQRIYQSFLKHFSLLYYLHPVVFAIIEGDYYIHKNADNFEQHIRTLENSYGSVTKDCALKISAIYYKAKECYGANDAKDIVSSIPSLVFDPAKIVGFWETFYKKDILSLQEEDIRDNFFAVRLQKICDYFNATLPRSYSDCMRELRDGILKNNIQLDFIKHSNRLFMNSKFLPWPLRIFVLTRIFFSTYGIKYLWPLVYNAMFLKHKVMEHTYKEIPGFVTSDLEGNLIFYDPAVSFYSENLTAIPGFDSCFRGINTKDFLKLIYLRFFTMTIFFNQIFGYFEDIGYFEFTLRMNPILEKHSSVLRDWYADLNDAVASVSTIVKNETLSIDSNMFPSIIEKLDNIMSAYHVKINTGRYRNNERHIFNFMSTYYIHGF